MQNIITWKTYNEYMTEEIIEITLISIHMIGMLLLLSGSSIALFIQKLKKKYNTKKMMIAGAVTSLIAGPPLVVLELDKINHLKVTIKLLVLIVIFGILYNTRTQKTLSKNTNLSIFILTIINILLAVLWESE